jgi:hypothetical protein
MIQLVKSRIDCEHGKETLLAYRAPIFRADWVYWIGCNECGRIRKWTHRQAESDRTRRKALITTNEEQAMETLYPSRKDDS